jgi:hypothetical protein
MSVVVVGAIRHDGILAPVAHHLRSVWQQNVTAGIRVERGCSEEKSVEKPPTMDEKTRLFLQI